MTSPVTPPEKDRIDLSHRLQSRLNRVVKRLRAKRPEPVSRYALGLAMLIAIVSATYLYYNVSGWKNPLIGVFAYLAYILLLLAAAWTGYLPGLLVLFSGTILPGLLGAPARTSVSDRTRSATCSELVSARSSAALGKPVAAARPSSGKRRKSWRSASVSEPSV